MQLTEQQKTNLLQSNANVLMEHADGFQRFTHTWDAIVACKSLFLTMREMLNESKHAGLMQVEVSVFVGLWAR